MCFAKKSGGVRSEVSSQAVALAPFSQNSKGCAEAGLAQAQETQAKPSALFCRKSASPMPGVTFSRSMISPSDFAEPQPPEGPS